ncbi:hypothetical protein ACHAXR_002067, partial [Thalassiosira sp. AJA248-18]
IGLVSSEGINISPQQLKEGLDKGIFSALLDVRTQSEWNAGHIDNATHIFNLASRGVEPTKILGCRDKKNCSIAVYCTVGIRAGNAIRRLVNEYGYESSNLYNGQGINQWQGAGFALVQTDEVTAECNEPDYQCAGCDEPDYQCEACNDVMNTTSCTKDENGVIQFEASSAVRSAWSPIIFFVAIAAAIT